MKIVYMGTPEFAVDALSAIVAAGHDVVAVYTQPDKAKGRSKALVPSPVKEKALELNIPVYQPEKIREEEHVEFLEKLAPEAIVVAAFGQILSERILNIPKYGCINIHASLLPKYRGAAPIERAIIDGEKVTGVTAMYMAKGVDTGDMIDKLEVPIADDETGGSLRIKLAKAGAELIVKTLSEVEAGTATRTKQDDALSTHAAKLTKEMCEIDFNKSAEEIERLIRGLIPWAYAYTRIDGKTVQICAAQVKADINGNAGEIVELTKKTFTIACGEGALVIRSLKPEGKKQMDTVAYLNGNKLSVGMKVGE